MYCKKSSGVELNSNFVKCENAEESIEEKNGYGMSLNGKLLLTNVKEEGDGEGGEMQCVEMKREAGMKDEEFEMSACNPGIVGDEKMETGEMVQPKDPDHGDGSPVSFSKGNSGETVVFACSQCPFIHVEEEKLHQHVQKAHQEEHNGILGYVGNGAENPLPPSSSHEHPAPLTTPPTSTQLPSSTTGVYTCSQCGEGFKSKSQLTVHEQIHAGKHRYDCSQCGRTFTRKSSFTAHMNGHKEQDSCWCSQCGKNFCPPGGSRKRQKTEKGKRVQLCAECEKSNEAPLQQNKNSGSMYQCPKCKKSFSSREEGLRHQNSYAGDHPLCCPQCGKEAPERITASKSLYHCCHCGANFGQISVAATTGKRQEQDQAQAGLPRTCPEHDKFLQFYCRADQEYICHLCVEGKHQGHPTVLASVERVLKQKQLGATRNKFLRRIRKKEKEQLDLRQAVKSLKSSAQEAVDDTEKIFTEVIRSIEERRTLVKNLIRDQEEAAVSRAQELLVGLEKEIVELRRRDAELERLLHSKDNIHFLKNYQFYSLPSGPKDLPSISVSPHFSFEAVREYVSKLKGLMEDVWKGELVNISHAVKMAPLLQPKTREDFLLYSSYLTLDPNTAYRKLSLCKEKRQVTRVVNFKSYPDHPERFDGWAQVLSREGLSGRSYWEAEWSGDDYVSIAVAYKGIGRKGWADDCGLGRNNKSWSLCCAPSRFYFWHNNRSTEIPVPSSSSRIGVYLDHRAGALSFFSVSDTMTLLFRVMSKFTQPLYCAFGIYSVGSSVRLSALD